MRFSGQLFALILTCTIGEQGLFVAGASATAQSSLSDAARLARLESQLESLGQDVAQLVKVLDNENKTVEFSVPRAQQRISGPNPAESQARKP